MLASYSYLHIFCHFSLSESSLYRLFTSLGVFASHSASTVCHSEQLVRPSSKRFHDLRLSVHLRAGTGSLSRSVSNSAAAVTLKRFTLSLSASKEEGQRERICRGHLQPDHFSFRCVLKCQCLLLSGSKHFSETGIAGSKTGGSLVSLFVLYFLAEIMRKSLNTLLKKRQDIIVHLTICYYSETKYRK